jgi:hypothetical protein
MFHSPARQPPAVDAELTYLQLIPRIHDQRFQKFIQPQKRAASLH